MTTQDFSLPGQATAMPVYFRWVLSNLQIGVLLLDSQGRVVMANKWFLGRAFLTPEQMVGQTLLDVFPILKASHFERALAKALKTGFPSILSQSLHPSPFPLFANLGNRKERRQLRQSIQIVPMGPSDSRAAGERITLIQIEDVSANVLREGLLKAQAEHMSSIAMVDGLTGIGNRRAFDDTLPAELRAATRGNSPLGLILLDIDHFKLYNDTYGHPAGDACLKAISSTLARIAKRPRDRVARYGGEELVVVLPETNQEGTLQVAHEILGAVCQLQIPHASSPTAMVVTLTAGVSMLDPSTPQTAEDLLQKADTALYAAKKDGRNRVWRFDPVASGPVFCLKT